MTSNSYSSLCDDFYLDMHVNTKLELLIQRDTVLTFFERIQKQFPAMGRFYKGQKNEYCLEEESKTGRHQWVMLEIDRIGSGVVNPSSFDQAYCLDRLVLDLVPYMLGISHLDIDSLDVTFAMDFDCSGSHDEVIAEALFVSTAFGCLLDIPGSRAIGFSPAVIIGLSEDERTQARVSIESKTSGYGPGEKSQDNIEAISLSLTIRQYPPTDKKFEALNSFEHQCQLCEEIMAEKIIPGFVKPLTETIAQRRSS